MNKIFLIVLLLPLIACGTKEVKWDATGVFEATEVVVSAEGNGNLVELNITEGQTVDPSEVIGHIDTVQLHLKRLQLLSQNRGTLSRRQDIAKQIAATEEQIRWQKSEKERFTKLLSLNAATAKQVDDIANQIMVLEKQLVAQRSTLENSNRSITDESSAIEIQVAQIEDQLLKCRVMSPIRGTVLVKYAEQGEYAQTGKPLFEVVDMDDIFLRAYITADQLTRMQLGQSVKVYSDFGATEQREYDGTVTWISSRSEFTPKTIQTRDERANLVYAVKIAVHNDGYLKIGMYGQMVL